MLQVSHAATKTPRGEQPVLGSPQHAQYHKWRGTCVLPGTEVSLRVGGQGVGSVVWYLKGSAVGGALKGQGSFNETFVDGQGGTGNLPGIPLNTHTFSAGPGAPVGFAHSRSSEWDFSGKQSRVFLDARTPSPYGEVKAYIEFDFAASNT